MMHLIKYRLLQTLRDKTTMFWALAFPIIMSVFFYFSIGKSSFEDTFKEIPAALVETGTEEENKVFSKYLDSFDGQLLKLEPMSEEEALTALNEGRIEGIFYDDRSLSVSTNGILPSILETLLDSYVKNEAMLTTIANEHPERLPQAVQTIQAYSEMTEEVAVGGKTLDTSLSFFFALIGMTCLYGCFPAIQTMMETRANLSPLGARQCVTPTGKMKRICANFLVTYLIQLANVMLVLCFMKYVLRLDFGNQMGGMILICMFGSLIGNSLGIVVGASGKWSEAAKIGVLIGICMGLCFLGGLMTPDIRTYIELYVPIINRINPAAIISDAFYCLNVFDDSEKLTRCLATLAGISVLLVSASFLMVRRERYDSL